MFKLAKAALLIVVAAGALKLLHKDVASVVEHLVEWLKLDPNNHYINIALLKSLQYLP